MSTFTQKIKSFFKEVFYFFTSKIFFKNLMIMIVSGGLFLVTLFWGLGWYTLHGESIEVPSLINLSVSEAEKLLKNRDLNFVISDSICMDCEKNLIGGLIKEQHPKPNSRVKESRKIYLTITRQIPCGSTIKYDDLIGQPLKFVQRKLKGMHLKIGKLDYISGKAANTIAKVSLGNRLIFEERGPNEEKPEDKYVPYCTPINLVLYEGMDAAPKRVPDLVCTQYGEAEFAVKTNQFNLGDVYVEKGIIDTTMAYVWKQTPAPGEFASMGTGVRLWLMDEMPEGCDEKSIRKLDDIAPDDDTHDATEIPDDIDD
ncbi:MAG: PASTA domain-containing protein [Aureispira sp.]|nr:PASTA domain-containing protein [Aureispira sp.]